MSDASWDSYLPVDSERLDQLADDLGTSADNFTATADDLGPEGAPLADAALDLGDASSSTGAAADWAAYSEHSGEVADAYRDEAANYLENAAREAEQGWTASAEYDLARADASLDMAGEYDGQSTSESAMSSEYLSDAGASMDAAAADVDAYAASDTDSAYDSGSYDAGADATE
ncbi:MAG: hypothetical protein WCC60_18675 [Ilumatobacteraceae bacterium]